MKNSKKILALTAVAMVLPAAVHAASTTIDATADFRAAITLGNEVDMQFGTIETSGVPTGSTATIGTDGSLSFAGNWTGAATGTAGSVDITAGSAGQTVEVRCDATGTLSDGTDTVDLINVEIIDVDNAGATGAGNACVGSGGASVMTYVLGSGTDTLALGGQLDGGTATDAAIAGSYSTANAGGTAVTVDVIYQ